METKQEKKERRIDFKLRDNPDTRAYIKLKKEHRELSNFMNEAVEFYFNYKFYRKQFLRNILEHHFDYCKMLLRRIGQELSH